jgi:cell division septation protein DedD
MAGEAPQPQTQQQPMQEEKPSTRETKTEEEPKKTPVAKPAANQSDLEIEILKVRLFLFDRHPNILQQLQKFCTFLHDRMLRMEDELERYKASSGNSTSSKSSKRHH